MQAEVRTCTGTSLLLDLSTLLLYRPALTPWEVGTFFLSLISWNPSTSLACGFFVVCQVFTSQRGMLWALQLLPYTDHLHAL